MTNAAWVELELELSGTGGGRVVVDVMATRVDCGTGDVLFVLRVTVLNSVVVSAVLENAIGCVKEYGAEVVVICTGSSTGMLGKLVAMVQG